MRARRIVSMSSVVETCTHIASGDEQKHQAFPNLNRTEIRSKGSPSGTASSSSRAGTRSLIYSWTVWCSVNPAAFEPHLGKSAMARSMPAVFTVLQDFTDLRH